MLTSLILRLQAPGEAKLPAALGRAGQALFLELLQARDPALAEELHQGDGPKPFTTSNLVLGVREAGALYVKAGQEGWLRFTGLTAPVSRRLQALAEQPPETIELGGFRFRVSGATLDPARHNWAGQISYQELAAPFLLGGKTHPDRKVHLEFVSPTTFKSKGHYLPLPLPDLVFGSLMDRWLAFAPIALSPEVRRLATEAVALSRYQTRSRSFPAKEGGLHIGFVGSVVFAALTQDRYWLNVLQLLAAFAFYSGVGYQTTSGLGQVRQVDS